MNSIAVRGMLVRGMLAGLLAGGFALLVSYFLGEPAVDAAIAFEEHHAGAHEHGEEALVTRTMQATAGLATGVLIYGVAIGGIAALVICYGLGRMGRLGPRAVSALISGAALVCVYVVPFLKYPANPPAVGDPETIGRRTALYFLLVVLAVILCVAAVLAGKALAPRIGGWWASVAGGVGFVLALWLAFVLMPGSGIDAGHFPADVLWEFRVATLAVHVTLWTAFGLVFGELAERLLAPGGRRADAGRGAVGAAAVQ
ncbi:CbtA family protein [Streptomyces sp. A7024]|uniref:CbtA family protein n=1 Tax=Streptomyces coryli TaxID=1128680 RepID=A0A6G4U2Z7_9ACTN|nr:CbtA family protein [Streptomyces coryli]NGN66605.1 CbtA family protein [Streptomyces coryli]